MSPLTRRNYALHIQETNAAPPLPTIVISAYFISGVSSYNRFFTGAFYARL